MWSRRWEFLGSLGGAGGGQSVASALVARLGCRVLLLFLRHACLLRPLSQAGKLQLAKVPSDPCPGPSCRSDCAYA